MVILRQGIGLLFGAWGDLTDAGVSRKTRYALERTLKPLISPTSEHPETSTLLGIRDIRARRAGSLMFVDLTADVSAVMSVQETHELEAKISRTLNDARRDIAEVRVKFQPVDETGAS